MFLTPYLNNGVCSLTSLLKSSERVGFEPTVPLNGVRVLSRDVPSATQPSFQRRAMLACGNVLVNKVRAGEPFAIEGVPMAGVDGAVRILDGDAVHGQIDVCYCAYSKILTKSGTS